MQTSRKTYNAPLSGVMPMRISAYTLHIGYNVN